MTYVLNNQEYEVVIEKKNNKNSYIRIKDDLKIYVSTSRYSTKKDIQRMLEENEKALEKMVAKKRMQLEKKENFFYLGNSYDIIEVSIMDGVEIENDKIYTPNKEALEKWKKTQIEEIFKQHYLEQWQKFEEADKIPQLKIRSMKTRWGVYNRKNHSVTLNSHLIEYSLEKLDYVIIHEFSHIVHFDHSKAFWQLVSKYCFNYKQIRKELKE